MSRGTLFGFAAVVLVVGSLIVGFSLLGTPAHARLLREDQQRVMDLERFANRARSTNMANVEAGAERDPETKRPYEVTRVDAAHLRECATFALPSEATQRGSSGFAYTNWTWNHPAGHVCFLVDIKGWSEPVIVSK